MHRHSAGFNFIISQSSTKDCDNGYQVQTAKVSLEGSESRECLSEIPHAFSQSPYFSSGDTRQLAIRTLRYCILHFYVLIYKLLYVSFKLMRLRYPIEIYLIEKL